MWDRYLFGRYVRRVWGCIQAQMELTKDENEHCCVACLLVSGAYSDEISDRNGAEAAQDAHATFHEFVREVYNREERYSANGVDRDCHVIDVQICVPGECQHASIMSGTQEPTPCRREWWAKRR